MAKLSLTVSAHRRFWFQPAFVALYLTCAMVSFVSWRVAGWLSDKGCDALARYGMKLTVG